MKTNIFVKDRDSVYTFVLLHKNLAINVIRNFFYFVHSECLLFLSQLIEKSDPIDHETNSRIPTLMQFCRTGFNGLFRNTTVKESGYR